MKENTAIAAEQISAHCSAGVVSGVLAAVPSYICSAMPALVDWFTECVALSAGERAERLRELRQQHPELVGQLDDLLKAHEHSSLGLSLWLRSASMGSTGNEPLPEMHIGQQIGRYRIDAKLGEGGMGQVYRGARDDDTIALPVAIKCARFAHRSSDALLHEATLMERLRHPGIAQFYDVLRIDDSHVAVVLEWVDGQSLEQRLQVGAIDPVRSLKWVIAAAQALSYAHERQVLHGDIKPSNLMLDHASQLKLIDFGIGVLLRPDVGSARATGLTPAFTAPETLLEQELSTRSDTYGLGRLLLRLWGDHSIWSMTDAASHVSSMEHALAGCSIPRAVRKSDAVALVRKACAFAPDDRYGSAAELANDLIALLDQQPVKARVYSNTALLTYWVKANKRYAAVIVSGLLAFALLFFSILQQRHQLAQALQAKTDSEFKSAALLNIILDSVEIANAESRPTELSRVEARIIDQLLAKSQASGNIPLMINSRLTAGQIALSAGQHDSAREYFTAALSLSDITPTERAHAEVGIIAADIAQARFKEAEQRMVGFREANTSMANDFSLLRQEGRLLHATGKYQESLTVFERALAVAPSRRERIRTAIELSNVLNDTGRHQQVLEMLDKLHPEAIEEFGSSGVGFGLLLQSRLNSKIQLGKLEDAITDADQIAEIFRSQLGPQSSRLADSLTQKATALRVSNAPHEAVAVMNEVLRIYTETLPAQHPKIINAQYVIGQIELDVGNYPSAITAFRQALPMSIESLGNDHILTAALSVGLGSALVRNDQYAEAVPILRQQLEYFERLNPAPDQPKAVINMYLAEAVGASCDGDASAIVAANYSYDFFKNSSAFGADSRAVPLMVKALALARCKKMDAARSAFDEAKQIAASVPRPASNLQPFAALERKADEALQRR